MHRDVTSFVVEGPKVIGVDRHSEHLAYLRCSFFQDEFCNTIVTMFFAAQDPNDRPTAGELLKDPWLVGSQKTLKMSWNKAAGLARRGLKPREAHRTLASVVQRMIDHDHSDAAGNRQGVLDDDDAEHVDRPGLSLIHI